MLLLLFACQTPPPAEAPASVPGLFPVPVDAAPGEDQAAWAPLADVVGDAAFIGIGEAEHGTRGLAELRNRATAWLVEVGGVRIVAQEDSWYEALAIDAALQECRQGVVPVPRTENLMWNDGTQGFLDWACGFNAAHPEDPVRVIGTDIQTPWHDMKVLRQVAETSDAVAKTLPGVSRCFGAGHESQDAFKAWAQENGFPAPKPEDHEACISALDTLDGALPETALQGTLAWQAPLAAQAIRTNEGSKRMLHVGTDGYGAQDIRDQGQKQALLLQRQALAPDARTVIWAHNAHVRADSTSLEGSTYTALGTLLARDTASSYVAIGTAGYAVRTVWGERADPPTPSPDSVEGTLHAMPFEAGIVVPAVWAFTKQGTVAMGRGERQVLQDQYAAILYLDDSPPAAY